MPRFDRDPIGHSPLPPEGRSSWDISSAAARANANIWVMEAPPPTGFGLMSLLRSLGDGLLAIIQGRLELISIELQEEKFRLIQIILWISVATFAGLMAITLASLTIVYYFWESARLSALTGLTLFYSIATVAIIVCFRRYLSRQPSPFSSSLEEIRNDRACIRPEN